MGKGENSPLRIFFYGACLMAKKPTKKGGKRY
jgi:hypothetical protein